MRHLGHARGMGAAAQGTAARPFKGMAMVGESGVHEAAGYITIEQTAVKTA